MSADKALHCQSSYREDPSSSSEFQSSVSVSKIKPIKKRSSRKKQFLFNHTVCVVFTDQYGKTQTTFHQKSKRMTTKSANISNMSVDHAKKTDKEIATKYEKLFEQHKIKHEKIESSNLQETNKEEQIQHYMPLMFPTFYALPYLPMTMQQYP